MMRKNTKWQMLPTPPIARMRAQRPLAEPAGDAVNLEGIPFAKGIS